MDTKRNRLQRAVDDIHARFGADALRQTTPTSEYKIFSTGFSILDAALGGGIPRGYMSEFAGSGASGNVITAIRILASATQAGKTGVYFDLSHTFDSDYAARHGVNVARLLLIRPVRPAETLEMVQTILRFRGAGVIVVDAVYSSLPSEVSPVKSITRLVRRTSTAVIVLTSTSKPRPYLSELVDVKLRFSHDQWLEQRQHVQGYSARVELVRSKLGVAGKTISIDIDRDMRWADSVVEEGGS